MLKECKQKLAPTHEAENVIKLILRVMWVTQMQT